MSWDLGRTGLAGDTGFALEQFSAKQTRTLPDVYQRSSFVFQSQYILRCFLNKRDPSGSAGSCAQKSPAHQSGRSCCGQLKRKKCKRLHGCKPHIFLLLHGINQSAAHRRAAPTCPAHTEPTLPFHCSISMCNAESNPAKGQERTFSSRTNAIIRRFANTPRCEWLTGRQEEQLSCMHSPRSNEGLSAPQLARP